MSAIILSSVAFIFLYDVRGEYIGTISTAFLFFFIIFFDRLFIDNWLFYFLL